MQTSILLSLGSEQPYIRALPTGDDSFAGRRDRLNIILWFKEFKICIIPSIIH